MKKTKGIYLALLAVLLSPMAANATVITTSTAVYDPAEDLLSITFSLDPLIDAQTPNGVISTVIDFDGGSASSVFSPLTQLLMSSVSGATISDQDGDGVLVFFPSAVTTGPANFSFLFGFVSATAIAATDGLVDILFNCGDANQASNYGSGFSCTFPNFDNVVAVGSGDLTAVPEPGTLALLGLGLIGMAARRRKV